MNWNNRNVTIKDFLGLAKRGVCSSQNSFCDFTCEIADTTAVNREYVFFSGTPISNFLPLCTFFQCLFSLFIYWVMGGTEKHAYLS